MIARPYGFRVVGHKTGRRRLVDRRAAFAAYAGCDDKAQTEREAYLSQFVFAQDFAEYLKRELTEKDYCGPCAVRLALLGYRSSRRPGACPARRGAARRGDSRALPRSRRSRYSLCWGEGDSRQGRSVPYKREWSEGRPDGHASQAGFFARSGRHHAQVAVSMTASDKLSPVVNGAMFDAREDAKGASGWSAIAGPYGLVHFGVIRGKRPSVGSIAGSTRSLAQGTKRIVRDRWTRHRAQFVVIRQLRAHGTGGRALMLPTLAVPRNVARLPSPFGFVIGKSFAFWESCSMIGAER